MNQILRGGCLSACENMSAYVLRSPLKVKVKVAQLCPTLCDLMDYIVYGILLAITLESVAVPFSRGSSQPRNQTQVCTEADSLLA